MTFRRIFLLAAAVALGGSVASSSLAGATRSNATVEAALSNGIQRAVDWDTDCRDFLRNGYMGSKFNSSGGGTLRAAINDDASYHSETWLSSAARGNTVTPIDVNSTDTSVPLRINDVIFICGPLVVSDLAGLGGGACRTTVDGADIVNNGSRWVTSNTNANDRAPNDFGGGCMYPAKGFQMTKITRISVLSDTTYGGTTTGGVNSIMQTMRDDDSRYWIGNTIPVTYKPGPSGFYKNGIIHLRMYYKKYSGYFSKSIIPATKNCHTGGPWGVTGRALDIDDCTESSRDLWVTIRLRANYRLVPAIAVTPPLLTPDNTAVTVAPSVNNTGSTATGGGISWNVTRFVMAPGKNYTTAAGYQDPCNKFGSYQAGSCKTVKSGSRSFALGTTNLGSFVDNPGSLPYGSKVCYFTSVKPFDDSVNEWNHSAPDCSIVGKRPSVVIQGNDLRVGSALAIGNNLASTIQASTLVTNGSTKGSWTEYGVTAPGTVSNMASGSSLIRDNVGASQSEWSKLTFANSGGFGQYASAANMGVLPDIGKYFQLTNSSRITKVPTGDITINSYQANTVIMSTGTVTIASNINAPNGNVPNIDALSQMIIIATGGVRISQNVQNIDAWIITPNGVIDTCYEQGGNLSTDLCNKQLAINGPVIAKSLKLRRTAGDEKTPAETINLRSDAYLWARKQSELTGTYQTKQITDLPPRY
jgi:hypothetical protein